MRHDPDYPLSSISDTFTKENGQWDNLYQNVPLTTTWWNRPICRLTQTSSPVGVRAPKPDSNSLSLFRNNSRVCSLTVLNRDTGFKNTTWSGHWGTRFPWKGCAFVLSLCQDTHLLSPGSTYWLNCLDSTSRNSCRGNSSTVFHPNGWYKLKQFLEAPQETYIHIHRVANILITTWCRTVPRGIQWLELNKEEKMKIWNKILNKATHLSIPELHI